MKLNVNKIKELSSEQIYKLLFLCVQNIYDTFSFVEINENDFKNIVIEEIETSKNEYTGDIDYTNYIKDKIINALTSKVSKELDNNKALKITNNYINKYFTDATDYNRAIRQIKKLNVFFETYDFVPSPDLLIDLINSNNKLPKIIEIIFNRHKKDIILGKSESIFTDNTLILIIESYCMINNIDINEFDSSDEENLDYNLEDDVETYLQEINKIKVLTKEEEQELFKRILLGDEKAREKLIQSNLRLVVSVAKKSHCKSMDFLDLVQEGNIGLMKAVEKFDYDKGYKFSTYAVPWIKQAISRAIADKGRTIRIPVNIYEKLRVLKKTVDNLELSLNREPTEEEIANAMQVPVSEIQKLLKLSDDTVSINYLVNENEDTELSHFIPAEDETPEDNAFTSSLKDDIYKLLKECNLSDRDIEIIKLRYGLGGIEPMKLEDIAKRFGFTRERVRQIEARVFKKIRRSKHVEKLVVYLLHPDQGLANLETYREGYLNDKYLYKKGVREYKRKKPAPKERPPKVVKSIYDYFQDYTKEEVNAAIDKLKTREKELLKRKYGEDLEHPIYIKVSREDYYKFYSNLLPKLRKMITDPDYGVKNKSFSSAKMKEITEKESQEAKQLFKQNSSVFTNSKKTVVEEKEEEVFNKSFRSSIIMFFETDTFKSMLNVMSFKEAYIISLKYGYINGKCLSNETIASNLRIKESEVIETCKKVLELFRDNFNAYLDTLPKSNNPDNSGNPLILK